MTADQERKSRSSQPFGGYYQNAAADDDNFLTATGAGTPCGDYLRRYWHPIMMQSELGALPTTIRILGEDLVIFRDKSGQIGLLHKHCIHRGASLEFGVIAEHGIQCCYHGWHFDVDGSVIATPAEPPASRIASNFRQGAYRTREAYGMIFAYMGPPELTPEFPVYDSFEHPAGNRLVPFKLRFPCNWLQVVENAADPIHNAFLHTIVSGQQFSAAFAVLPALDFPETPLGFLSMATRKVRDFVFIRASDIILPNVGQFLAGSNAVTQECFAICSYLTRWVVPVDDHNCFYLGVFHFNDYTKSIRPLDESNYGLDKMDLIGQTADRPYEERQREPGDYDALMGQGAIANRKAEHLGQSDRGIVLLRRQLRRAVEAVRSGETPAVPRLYPDGKVRTYAHELVFALPSQSNIRDLSAVGDFGRRAARIVIDTDELPPAERETAARERIRHLVTHELVS